MLDWLEKRYATKSFEPNRDLSTQQVETILALLQKSPSSVNSQPWHFFVAQSAQAKQQLAQAASGVYQANHAKISNASLVVVFCAKTDLSDDYLEANTAQEKKDGRMPDEAAEQMVRGVRQFYANLHRHEATDLSCWLQNQVYLNLGFFLAGVAAMGLDAVPIEGVDLTWLNQELALESEHLTSLAMVAVGYAAADDFNAKLPKSRRPLHQVVTDLDA